MPHEIIGEVVEQVVQGAAEVTVDKVHKEFGWKGCLILSALVISLGVGLYFVLR